MKALDKAIIVLFVLCLIFSSIVWPAVTVMTQDTYYINQFEKTGTLPEDNELKNIYFIGGDYDKVASFTNKQIKELVKHITDFFKDEDKSFKLTMDGVLLNGEVSDNVNIFSDVAVTHMDDVKILYNNIKTIAYIAAVILVGCVIYMLKRKSAIQDYIFKWSLGTVLALICVILLFLLFVFIKVLAEGYGVSGSAYTSELWYYLHYIFFPFNSEKFNGAFFNDTLTEILTLDFFMNTVVFIALILIAVMTIWLIIAKKAGTKKQI